MYARTVSYVITRMEKEDDGYFTVAWSPLIKADKYDIHQSVPAVGGVAEIYYKDETGRLCLFRLARSWYGGIRAVLREGTDPDYERDERLRAILEAHKEKIYYRYSTSNSKEDLDDVLFFLYETLSPGRNPVEHSGRYERIYLKEVDAWEKTKE